MMVIIIMFLLAKNNMIKIENYFDKLFPLNRSITGEDYQKSINIISEIIPLRKLILLQTKRFLTGKFQKSGMLKRLT